MKKPKYIESIYALIFLCLGSSFLIMGCLCLVGIVKPSAHSYVQSPNMMGIVFSSIGLISFVAQTGFRFISNKRAKLHNELLSKGIKLMGTVEKVYLQKGITFGCKSPFRICYTYSYQSEIYRHKSYLLWDKPNFNEGDAIEVYIGDFGESTLSL